MKKSDFDKLTEGQRVVVSGTQDGRTFTSDVGIILEKEATDNTVNIKFDKPSDELSDKWWFFRDEARKFTIVPAAPKVAVEAPSKKRPHGKQEYRGNGKHSWEVVTGDTVRLRVPGGWLYGKRFGMSGTYSSNTTFVPVPNVVGYAV